MFSGARLFILGEAATDPDPVLGSQKSGGVRPVEDHPPAEQADENGREAFDDEYPRPAGLAADAVHLRDGGREEASEGSGKCGGREEGRCANAEFASFVPA